MSRDQTEDRAHEILDYAGRECARLGVAFDPEDDNDVVKLAIVGAIALTPASEREYGITRPRIQRIVRRVADKNGT